MSSLSVLVPAQNEEFLERTIRNILDNIGDDTDIIVVLDGYTIPVPEIPKDPRVKIISLPRSVGSKIAANIAAKISTAKYVFLAHAKSFFDKGFDKIFLRDVPLSLIPREEFLKLDVSKEEPELTKNIVYYTDNMLDEKVMKQCQEQLQKSGLPIVSVSLKPIKFGQNYVVDEPRGYYTLTKQIIKGLEESKSDVVFFAEHDVLYHPSHFVIKPTGKDIYCYNMNSWMLRAEDGHCLYYDHRSLSGMCCYRDLALVHFRKRKERIEALLKEGGDTGRVKATSGSTISLKEGIQRLGFEPGTHNRPEKVDDYGFESWKSDFPNVDIRHSNNLTQNRFRKDQFRNVRSYAGWTESDSVPGWGKGKNILS